MSNLPCYHWRGTPDWQAGRLASFDTVLAPIRGFQKVDHAIIFHELENVRFRQLSSDEEPFTCFPEFSDEVKEVESIDHKLPAASGLRFIIRHIIFVGESAHMQDGKDCHLDTGQQCVEACLNITRRPILILISDGTCNRKQLQDDRLPKYEKNDLIVLASCSS